jgi:pyruvate kinase
MLVNSSCFVAGVGCVCEEGSAALERFQGLRKQAVGASRRRRVGLRSREGGPPGGGGGGGGRGGGGPGRVRATTMRPGRYVKERGGSIIPVSPEDGRINFLEDDVQMGPYSDVPAESRGAMWVKPSFQRKTKIVCTIGPTSNTKEMIRKLAEAGMNVARLNMSHGDHASHKKVSGSSLFKGH